MLEALESDSPAHIPVLLLTLMTCVSLGRLLSLLEPQFSPSVNPQKGCFIISKGFLLIDFIYYYF